MNFTTASFSAAPARHAQRIRRGRAAMLGVAALFAFGATMPAYAATAPTVETDRAGNRMEPLSVTVPAKLADAEQGCTDDRQVCVEIRSGDVDRPAALRVTRIDGQAADVRADFDDPSGDNHGGFTLWPHVLRVADAAGGVIVGVEYNLSTGYSGGGASASELRLIRVVPEGAAFRTQEVLTVSLSGSAMIRACFSERDERRRLGACHDEYAFNATLHLDRAVGSGFPRLLYATRATSFPGHVSRDKDSLAAPPLRKRDLVTVVDRQCTYRRSFGFEPASATYVPDRPLPACDGYTVP
ncbi:hypothetical protein HT746_23880 [Burkholderia pyrrocinia]|uniref:hypothetical protein n=1 Tax=Burkholderia pyrrocinia TaxID=60550 RepID=UPI001575DEFF|nr:hypothetical protein [Burkholderia pyrrocinia]NTX30122.1 hypothetical protein [Burkholderia pyrrocinia]